MLALVNLTVTVTTAATNDNGYANFFAAVTIDGVRQESPREFSSSLIVNWPITQLVDDGAPIPVEIELLDDGQGPLDIDPKRGDKSIYLWVDPLTGIYNGDLQWPQTFSDGVGGDGRAGNLSFEISIPGVTTDQDGDGLIDGWERSGIDLDINRSNGIDLPLNTWGARFDHKDIFVEFDWMAGAAPSREAVQSVKAAFAVAPIDAGTQASAIAGGVDASSNPDGQPGINLWIDTGGLLDAQGRLVGDNFGGGNQVPTENVSNLNVNFYNLKNTNFNAVRNIVFRYAISATSPANTVGTSSGNNFNVIFSSAFNDSSQKWVKDEWSPGANGVPLTLTITGGTGSGQSLPIVSNDATTLILDGTWATLPDNTSTYAISWGWGGWGERGGNDFIDYNHNAITFMHELGHNLNLHHGGFEGTNYKPNYVSIMNYDFVAGIPQNSGATLMDFAPARISVGGTSSGNNTATTFRDNTAAWTTGQWVGGYVEVSVPFGYTNGGNTLTTLNDNRQNWGVNQWVGLTVTMDDFSGSPVQNRTIVSNTSNQLTVNEPWTAVPPFNSSYVFQTTLRQTRRIVSNTATQLVFSDPWTFVPAFSSAYALYTSAQARSAPLPAITENALDETLVLDPTDTANRMIFNNGRNTKVQYPLNGVNRDADGPVDGPDYNGSEAVETTPVAVNVNRPGDTVTSDTSYNGQDDWRRISLPFRQFGNSTGAAINLEDHAPPPLAQVMRDYALLNTTDLQIAVTPSAGSVFQGDHLIYTYTVSTDGPNPADGVLVVDNLPNGVDFISATSSQGSVTRDGDTVSWNVGSVYPGVPLTLRLEIIPYLVGNTLNTGIASTFDPDSNRANNVATATVAVLNVPPRITAVRRNAAGINENGAVGLTVEFTDPGKFDMHTGEIDWGEGPVQVVTVALGDRQFARSHQYFDDNPTNTLFDTYPIRVILRDNNAGSGRADTTVRVNNVDPTLTNMAVTPAIDEHGVVTVSGGIHDPGTQDTFTLVINWGEGGPQTFTYPAGTTSFSETHQYLDDNPTATPQDKYNIILNLSDDDSGVDTAVLTTRVNNVRPTLLNLAITPQIDEHGVVTVSGGIHDPGTQDKFTLVINWGEGGPQTFTYPAGTTNFSETHQYFDDNPSATPQDAYNITLNLRDDDSGADTAALTTLVKNVAPVIATVTSTAVECGGKAEGDTVHVVGAFTDVGTQDTHIASISWGDGATTTATIVEGAGAGSIAGEHIYASGGMFRIVVTLTDDDTGQTTARTFALITGVGILDGQLQIVGTKQADDVLVNRSGNGWFKVHASFIADSPRSLPAAGVTSIAMILCNGDDRATVAGNIDLPTSINGEEGDDQLNGGGGPNILLGGLGNDRISGGSSHDILVGGPGADRIVGNGGDDILIAGTLGGSSDPIDLLDELIALLANWSRDRDRARIRSRLLVGGDSDADILTGSAGVDWFFYDLIEDKATDGKNEPVVNIG